LGGRARLESIETWDVEGHGRENLTAEVQGLAPDEPTWRPHEERLGIDMRSLSVAWHRKTPRNDLSVRFRRMIYKPDAAGFVDFVSGVGRLRPAEVPEAQRRAFVRRVPHLLLLEAATRATDVRWETDGVVSVTFPEDFQLRLTFGSDPMVLREVAYARHMPTLGDVTVRWEWYGWRPDDALGLVPEGHRITVDDVLFHEVAYSRYSGGSPDVMSLFEIPELEPALEPSRPVPASRLPATGEVAAGVHVAEIAGFTVMFVEFREFLVAVEAPETHAGLETIPAMRPPSSVTESFLDLLKSSFPGKPIRYVVVSHHHGDHMGGIRRFAAEGATIVVAPGHERAARHALDRPHTLAPDPWKGSSGEATLEVVPDRRVIADGTRTLEIVNTGDNPHTRENLFVWLPADRILFQGDLFYYTEGAPFPPPGRETMNRCFSRFLRENGIEPEAIYGVHDRGAFPRERLEHAKISAQFFATMDRRRIPWLDELWPSALFRRSCGPLLQKARTPETSSPTSPP
jgi:glyoxylase-like metal-dependent hydrolase (beta-lactamase superfamily II)